MHNSNPISRHAKIFITNYNSPLGISFIRRLKKDGYNNLLFKNRSKLNLLDIKSTRLFFKKNKPDYVFLLPELSGGIKVNNERPADFLYNNLQTQTNIIHASWESKVKKLLFIAASCVYPKNAPQPLKERYLLNGPLELSSEAYSIAKITGIKMCQSYNKQYGTNFISVVPASVYGPGDNLDTETSHVIPALIKKCHDAKIKRISPVTIWGSGNAEREFIYADDMVDACLFLMANYSDSSVINVGSGEKISIYKLAVLIKNIVGYEGTLKFSKTMLEGAKRKILDITKLTSLGWKSQTSLKMGLQNTYKYLSPHHFNTKRIHSSRL